MRTRYETHGGTCARALALQNSGSDVISGVQCLYEILYQPCRLNII